MRGRRGRTNRTAFYRRRGYDFTGASEQYPLDPRQSELEMSLALR